MRLHWLITTYVNRSVSIIEPPKGIFIHRQEHRTQQTGGTGNQTASDTHTWQPHRSVGHQKKETWLNCQLKF
jgi:hypothetical protein